MTTFDNREFGYEAKFAHDQEVIFKATARRNKLIAHWAADKLGFVEEEAAKYADLMIRNSLKVSDDDDVVHRILGGLSQSWHAFVRASYPTETEPFHVYRAWGGHRDRLMTLLKSAEFMKI